MPNAEFEPNTLIKLEETCDISFKRYEVNDLHLIKKYHVIFVPKNKISFFLTKK